MLTLLTVGSVLLGFVCGAYQGKGKKLNSGQAPLFWILTALLALACTAFYLAGGVLVYAGCYLIFCVGQLVGLLLHTGREKKDTPSS